MLSSTVDWDVRDSSDFGFELEVKAIIGIIFFRTLLTNFGILNLLKYIWFSRTGLALFCNFKFICILS